MVIPQVMLAKLHHATRHHSARAYTPPLQAPLKGVCLAVPDGDGCTLRTRSGLVTIRLFGIDAPEWGQPAAYLAWRFLAERILGRTITAHPITRDHYGRTVATVTTDAAPLLALELVLAGLAWHYRQYAPGATELATAETLARRSKKGLWAHPSPVPTWIYRHRKKSGT